MPRSRGQLSCRTTGTRYGGLIQTNLRPKNRGRFSLGDRTKPAVDRLRASHGSCPSKSGGVDKPVHAIFDREPEFLQPQKPPWIGKAPLMFTAHFSIQLAVDEEETVTECVHSFFQSMSRWIGPATTQQRGFALSWPDADRHRDCQGNSHHRRPVRNNRSNIGGIWRPIDLGAFGNSRSLSPTPGGLSHPIKRRASA